MSFSLNSAQGLVIVHAEVLGPSGSAILQLALDTGATSTLINAGPLVALGYDPALSQKRAQVTTGSGIEFVPVITLLKITALGHDQPNFPVLCHTLPPSATVDGLLGLDFLRGKVLTLDFLNGQITLT
jgi:predicted aspartyl protease